MLVLPVVDVPAVFGDLDLLDFLVRLGELSTSGTGTRWERWKRPFVLDPPFS